MNSGDEFSKDVEILSNVREESHKRVNVLLQIIGEVVYDYENDYRESHPSLYASEIVIALSEAMKQVTFNQIFDITLKESL